MKGNIESSRIFYLLEWIFQILLINWQTCAKVAKVLSILESYSSTIPFYLGSFDTSYIVFTNVEIFGNLFISNKEKIVKKIIESFKILYLLKWNYSTNI